MNERQYQVTAVGVTSVSLLPFYRTFFGHQYVYHNHLTDTFSIFGEDQPMRRDDSFATDYLLDG